MPRNIKGAAAGLTLLLGSCAANPVRITELQLSTSTNIQTEEEKKEHLLTYIYTLDDRQKENRAYETPKTKDSQGDTIPCGPKALYHVSQRTNIETDIQEINFQRKGGIIRNLAGIFNEKAHDITFPYEIQTIAKRMGFNVQTHTGKKANLQTILEEYQQGKEIVVRVELTGYFDQHYVTFDPKIIQEQKELIYHDGTSLESPIHEIYALTKKE